ncbi:site-specific DNA-methyltransferase [Leucobacter sp. HY1910]
MTTDRPRIDVLLDRISDPGLRGQLRAEVSELSGQRKFGLVYEGHAPEAIRLPGARVKRGATVQYRTGSDHRIWKVLRSRAGAATIATRDGDRAEDVPVSDLVVARELGDPVYPGFTPLGSIERGGDKPHHLVIQGENYHALQTLLYTHKNAVDLIYIDPPYNTGAGDWIYNDRYVGDADAYRHSKWLSFMEKRLALARKLLKPTGIIVVAIGDHEHHRLRMLLDQEFGEKNFIANFVWQGGGSSLSRFHAGGIDYMLTYSKDMTALTESDVRWKVEKEGLDDVLNAAADSWEKSGHDSEIASKLLSKWWGKNKSKYDPGLGDNVKIDDSGQAVKVGDLGNSVYRPNLKYPITDPVSGVRYSPPENGWRFRREVMDELISSNSILFGSRPRLKTPLVKMSMRSVMPSFYKDRRSASQHLAKVLGSKDFPFPKDVEVISKWINIVTSRNNQAVVLDFFAGTGTTTEAVMRLNAVDEGNRQAIVVTNNEVAKTVADKLTKQGVKPGDDEWEAQGVFEKVTRPRVATVAEGTRPDGSIFGGPLNENVTFLKLDYLERDDVELGKAFRQVAELLWVKAGSVGPVIAERSDSYTFTDRYGVLFDTDRGTGFEAEAARRGVAMVFVITDSAEVFGAVHRALPDTIRAVHLYRNYLSNFEINTRKAL